jgi:indolepyruvate ferredoxin oxidoreductase
LLGYAFQLGALPVSSAALEQAIAINGVAVETNLRVFRWGRLTADQPDLVEKALGFDARDTEPAKPPTVDEIITRRADFLTKYQNVAYAGRYRDLVGRAQKAEGDKYGGDDFARAVAENAFKLMAYKDEYEVARLHSGPEFRAALERQFEVTGKLEFHLAPPLLSRADPITGKVKKRSFGPWMMNVFRLLAAMRGLRGTAFDVFGYQKERRIERELIRDYKSLIETMCAKLSPENHKIAVSLAALPADIKGYGHVKNAAIEQSKTKERKLIQSFSAPAQKAAAE